MIEKGRHKDMSLHDRKCPFCKNTEIEDETHFLLKCQTFSPLRNEMMSWAKNIYPDFENRPIDHKLKSLLSDNKLIPYSGSFLRKCFLIRRFLLREHKNLM